MNPPPPLDQKRRILGLDILRATAILMVLVAHTIPGRGHAFFPEFISGLFSTLGVELFFVLSGFLIGGILIRDIENAPARRISVPVILNFWKRRWLRTLPACYVFLALHIALEAWLTPGYDALSRSIPFFFFVQNLLWPHPNLFQEYWSLATEEWFYLLFPAFLSFLSLWKLRTRHVVFAGALFFLIVPTVLRGVLDLHAGWDEGVRKVAMLRLDALMYGVLGALLSWRAPELWKRFARPVGLIGMLLLGALVIYCWKEYYSIGHSSFDRIFLLSVIPFALALFLPFFSTEPLLDRRAHPPGTSAGHILRFFSAVVTHISLISYSLYLCHNPCIRAVNRLWQDYIGPLTPANRIPIIVLQWICFLAVAHFSFRFIEIPFLKLRDRAHPH